uniref:Putative RING finger protein C2A9.04c n=1 Tax=Aceria tosichella TaxID=561515 RepID=A0A6G1SE69_9ACAR
MAQPLSKDKLRFLSPLFLIVLWTVMMNSGVGSMPTGQLAGDDYAASEQEFAEMLERAIQESANTISRPENFVQDDLSPEQVMELFERATNQSQNDDGVLTASNVISVILQNSTGSQAIDNNAQQGITTTGGQQQQAEANRTGSSGDGTTAHQPIENSTAIHGQEEAVTTTPVSEPITSPPCPICLDDLVEEDKRSNIDLKCGHRFHKPCIRDWLNAPSRKKDQSPCPMCYGEIDEADRRLCSSTTKNHRLNGVRM